MSRVSVVVPVYNEEGNLAALHERLRAVAASSADQYDFIFVDDGSKDGSLEIMRRLAREHANVTYLSFSRNFGHEMATTAGLDYATGDAVVIIDADLQDPPEVIPELVAKWREGFQVVYARRRRRQGESPVKLLLAWSFYRVINTLSDCPIPVDTGDFRLMDQCVVAAFRQCRERHRFVRGLVAWTGFRQTAVEYDRAARHAGQTNYGFFKLVHLAFDVVTGFSSVPLRIGIVLGLVVCLGALVLAATVVAQKLIWGIPMQGYALLATGLFFLGGVQLLVMGLIGLYVGRLYGQAQERPLYLVREKSAALAEAGAGGSPPAKDPGRS